MAGDLSIIVMLYDSPYPTVPQYDLVPHKANRNADIITRCEAGETGDSIARAFGISEQHINQIIPGQRS